MLNTKNFATLDTNALKRPVVSFHRIQYNFLHFYSKIKKKICLCITWIHIGYSLLALIKYIKRSYILTGQEERGKKKKKSLLMCYFCIFGLFIFFPVKCSFDIINFTDLFYYSAYFYYFSWVSLHFLVLFHANFYFYL